MKVLMYAFGTQGDIQPYVALARGLNDAGHEGVVCTSEGFRDLVTDHGAGYAYMNNDMLSLVQDAMPEMRGPRDAFKIFSSMSAAMKSSMQDQWTAAQELRPDVIIYHPKCFGGFHIAEKLGIPGISSLPLPFFTATRDFPIPFIGRPSPLGWLNRVSYQFQRFTAIAYGGMINDFRRNTLGVGPASRLDDFMHLSDGSPVPVLYPFSRHVQPVPDDYPPEAHVTGYWFLDHPDTWETPAELTDFLAAGEPPVYVGFGSMGFGKGSDKRLDAILTALSRNGVRGVLASGWGGLQASDLPDNIVMIKNAPHDWLFPRMAAVVHHGGAGTTGAGLRAGRPTLICPFLGDQPYWGYRVHQLGAGPEPLPQRSLNANRLTERIRQLLEVPHHLANAEALGLQIQAEDGIGQAIKVLEDIHSRD